MLITLTMRMAGVLLAGSGIIAAMFGPGSPRASADTPQEELQRLSVRYAYTTCVQLTQYPNAQGVDAAVADVMDRNGVSRYDAEQVVAMSVRSRCPQFLPVVQQVVPGAPGPA